MKRILWGYWLAVTIICTGAWFFLGLFGPYIVELVGGKPLPGITWFALVGRPLFLGIPFAFAIAALLLACSSASECDLARYQSFSLSVIVGTLSLLLLATILPYTMGGPRLGGQQPSTWRWLLFGS